MAWCSSENFTFCCGPISSQEQTHFAGWQICLAGHYCRACQFGPETRVFGSVFRPDGALRTGTLNALLNLAMKTKPLMLALTSAAVLLCGPAVLPTSAQLAVPPPTPVYQPIPDPQLDQLLGPIALYPDPLLAQVLRAAAFPAQIVLADRYVMGGGDPSQIDWQPWDPSVRAMAHYPSILKYMDDNLGWTTELGQAFLYQQEQVMASVQRLRVSAWNFGNLVSTPQENVVYNDGDIEILPAEPDVIYVPVYQPTYVYCRTGFSIGFGVGCWVGPWLNCDFDWRRHGFCFWDRDHPRPEGWWHDRAGHRDGWRDHGTAFGRPGDHREGDAGRRGDWNQNHQDGRNWRGGNDRGWGDRNGRGWNNSPAQTSDSRHDPIVTMSHPTVVPRPAATPRPAASRPTGAIYVANPPAPAARSDYRGASPWNNGSRYAGNFGNRGQASAPAPAWSGSANSGQFHTSPMRTEPMHTESIHFTPSAPSVSHSAPSFHGGGGGGGGNSSGGGGGGSHNSGSQSRH